MSPPHFLYGPTISTKRGRALSAHTFTSAATCRMDSTHLWASSRVTSSSANCSTMRAWVAFTSASNSWKAVSVSVVICPPTFGVAPILGKDRAMGPADRGQNQLQLERPADSVERESSRMAVPDQSFDRIRVNGPDCRRPRDIHGTNLTTPAMWKGIPVSGFCGGASRLVSRTRNRAPSRANVPTLLHRAPGQFVDPPRRSGGCLSAGREGADRGPRRRSGTQFGDGCEHQRKGYRVHGSCLLLSPEPPAGRSPCRAGIRRRVATPRRHFESRVSLQWHG